jgi:hypothetical protein
MRKWSLITAVLLLSFTWVVAQTSGAPPADNSQSNQPTSQQPGTSQTKQPASADQNARTIEGCITSVAGGYTLTDNSGKTYQLAGDTSKLASENGHWDQVTGTEDTSMGAAASAGAPSTFTVRKIKMVSTTCPTK